MALQHDVSTVARVAKTIARDIEAPRDDVVVQNAAYEEPAGSGCMRGTSTTTGEVIFGPKDAA